MLNTKVTKDFFMSADIQRDILIVGAGAAGMYAAISAARNGASVLLVDKSIVGRGGATVMAQMTVAAAISSQTDDHWSVHLEDTLESGRNLCDPTLARVLCQEAPERIREMDAWNVGWAREMVSFGRSPLQGIANRAASMLTFSTPGQRSPAPCASR